MKHTNTLAIAVSAFTTLTFAYGDTVPDAKIGKAKDAATSAENAVTYSFSKKSIIEFKGAKVIGSHSGGFKKFTGEFKLEDGAPTSGSFTIDMTSLWSDDKKLTGHLKSGDFFDVANHKESTFVATGFKKNTDNSYTVSGNLMMVAKTQNITFPATVEQDGDKVSMTAVFNIDRQKWGISYPGMPDNLIKDAVLLKLSLIAKKD